MITDNCMMLQISIQSICTCTILLLVCRTCTTSQDQPNKTADDEAYDPFDDENPARAPPPPLSFSQYFNYQQIVGYYNKEPHPFLEWSKIGSTTVEDKAIWLATIRNPKKKQKRAIFIDALMIPCEYHTASIVMYIMNELLTNSLLYQDILDTTTLYIVPVANRDGFIYNFAKTLTSKHARIRGLEMFVKNETFKNPKMVDPKSMCPVAVCNGTNIALNFPFEWTTLRLGANRNFTLGGGTIKDVFEFNSTSSPHYRGTHACSEKECQAISNFLKNHKDIDTYVTLHGFINFWALPYAHKDNTRPENYAELGKLAAAITEAINEENHETSRYGPFQKMYDLEQTEIFNGKEHPGTPLDYAKSIGIRFTFWAGFGESNYPRYLEADILRVCQDAFKGFLVLFRLKDKHNRSLFPSKSASLQRSLLSALLCISAHVLRIS